MSFHPVDRPRAYEAIVDQITSSIQLGTYVPGQQLPSERELADSFDVSRVVVREAMRHLESRGVVEVRHGSGSYVRDTEKPTLTREVTLLLELEAASLMELYSVRQSLETLAASLAAENASEEQLAALDEALEDLERLRANGIRDLEEYQQLCLKDSEFHMLIADASGNSALRHLLGAILPLIVAGRIAILPTEREIRKFVNPAHLRLVQQEHADVWQAIRDRDGRAAEYFTAHHIRRSIRTWARDAS